MPEKGREVSRWFVDRGRHCVSRRLVSDSVRAWRGLRFNENYATKLEKKLAKKRAQAAAKSEKNRGVTKSNPFSVR
jgi:hypothetical protein